MRSLSGTVRKVDALPPAGQAPGDQLRRRTEPNGYELSPANGRPPGPMRPSRHCRPPRRRNSAALARSVLGTRTELVATRPRSSSSRDASGARPPASRGSLPACGARDVDLADQLGDAGEQGHPRRALGSSHRRRARGAPVGRDLHEPPVDAERPSSPSVGRSTRTTPGHDAPTSGVWPSRTVMSPSEVRSERPPPRAPASSAGSG